MQKHEKLVQTPKNVKELMAFALRPYRKRSIVFLALTSLGVACWNASTFVASKLINELSESQAVTNKAWMILGLFAVFRIMDEVFWRTGEVLVRTFKPELVERVRQNLFAVVLQRPHGYFVNSSSGRIAHWINQTTQSVDQVINNTIWGAWGEILGLTLSTIFLFTTHWSLAVIFSVWLIVLFWFNGRRGKRFSELVADESNEKSKGSSIVVDSIANSLNVRVFNAQVHERDVLNQQQQKIIAAWKRSWRFGTTTNAVKGLSSGLVNVGAIAMAVWLFSRGEIGVGGLALFLAYFNSASSGLWNLAWNFDEYYRQFGTIQNALDGLSGELERDEMPENLPAASSAAIKLDTVTFVYPEAKNQHVLSKLTLDIKPGQKVGIVGHSGAGKSTLVGLLLGFYKPESGEIYLNGEPVSAKDPSFIRAHAAFVPQDTTMFNRTVRENILYARPDASDAELRAAIEKAHASEFIKKLPDGLDTLVGERGVKLSGGQRQRIAIARAILRDAPLLILDEATSALDSVSEQAIQKALHELMKGRTAVVIAHRLSTLKHLDMIVVMDKGRIIESGTHEQLLEKKDGVYADLWRRQKDGFIVE